jgi:hypothetical protein
MEYNSDTVGGCSLWLVQVKLSLVLLDALSEITLRRELELVYDALKVEADDKRRSADSLSEDVALLPNIGVHFRDYVTALATQLPASAAYKRDLAYWTARLDTLPEPPALPLLPVATASIAALPAVVSHSFPQGGIATGTANTAPAAGATFRHLAGALSRDQWGHFKRMCARHSMTPTACLAAVYAHALAAWQAAPKDSAAESPQRCGPTDRVLINVMHTTRLPLHPDIGAVFGNFSSTSLLDACVNQTTPFADTAAKIAEQLASDLEHWRYGIALFFFLRLLFCHYLRLCVLKATFFPL